MLMENKLCALATMIEDTMRGGFSDLSPSAAAAVLTLRYREPLTTSELAAIVGVAQPTAVRLVDGLVRSGLVRRGSREGRSAPLRLEAKGRRRADRLQAARLRAAGDLVDGLSRSECQVFNRVVDKLLARGTRGLDHARTSCRLCDHELCTAGHCPVGARAQELNDLEGS